MSDNSKNRAPKAGRVDVQVNPEMDRAIDALQSFYDRKGITLSKSAVIRMAVIQCASGVNLRPRSDSTALAYGVPEGEQ